MSKYKKSAKKIARPRSFITETESSARQTAMNLAESLSELIDPEEIEESHEEKVSYNLVHPFGKVMTQIIYNNRVSIEKFCEKYGFHIISSNPQDARDFINKLLLAEISENSDKN